MPIYTSYLLKCLKSKFMAPPHAGFLDVFDYGTLPPVLSGFTITPHIYEGHWRYLDCYIASVEIT